MSMETKLQSWKTGNVVIYVVISAHLVITLVRMSLANSRPLKGLRLGLTTHKSTKIGSYNVTPHQTAVKRNTA